MIILSSPKNLLSIKIIGVLGILSGVLHIWTFLGFGELRYFSLFFVALYGGLGLLTYLGKKWAMYTLFIAMLLGAIGVVVAFNTNTLPAWIRIILITIDVLVVIGVPLIHFRDKTKE